jgi:drug/metabolite transporter (DMT)-like permease
VFTTGVAFILMSWAIKRRGPIYLPMFNSLAMIATVVMDSVLLGTSIFLGR